MPERIFDDAVILAGEELEPVDGYLKVEDGKIMEIKEGDPPKEGVDLGGGYILPPFVNSHTHIGDSVRKGVYQGKSQEEVVSEEGKKFEALEQISDDKCIESMRETLLEMKECGVLAHCDFRENGIEGTRLLNQAKINSVETTIMGRPSSGDNPDKLLELADGIGLPSLESYPSGEMEKISKMAAEEDKFLSFHVSETGEAHEKSLEKYGATEIERALEFDPSFLIHGTWATDKDLTKIEQNNIPLVVCPRTNSLLSVGLPPIKDALEKNIELWLGTDNASVSSPDIMGELSFAWAVLRLQSEEAGHEEARELLKAATINPTDRLDVPFGPLQEGKETSFLVVRRGRNLSNFESPHLAITSRARKDNLEMIYRPDGE